MININNIKKVISESIFLDKKFLEEFISKKIFLKPNIKGFDELKIKFPLLKSSYFYLYNKGEIRIKVFDNTKFEQIKNIFVENSRNMGGFSVNQTQEGEISLIWPVITEQRKKETKNSLKQVEVLLLEELRNKRQKCKKNLYKDATKEDAKIIDKILEEIFNKEKNKILSTINIFLKQI